MCFKPRDPNGRQAPNDTDGGRTVYLCIGVLAALAGALAIAAAIALACEDESWLVVAVIVLFGLLLCVAAAFCCITQPTFEEGRYDSSPLSSIGATRRKVARA